MKKELASFAIAGLRREGFTGRGGTLRVIGDDLQWVSQVEKVSHVDQVNVEIGIVFATPRPMSRVDCRVLWSLDSFVGVESDDVAPALLPGGEYTIDEREEVVGNALKVMAAFVHKHTSISSLREAYRRGQLAKAFMFADARELLEAG